jgi:hypothetical protein
MRTFVTQNHDTTLEDLKREIEHFTGVATQRRDARRDLKVIEQRPNETINEYYHRISSLWQKAGTPEEDRVDQFLTTMLPTLSVSLLSTHRSRVREVLDDARAVESIPYWWFPTQSQCRSLIYAAHSGDNRESQGFVSALNIKIVLLLRMMPTDDV